MKYFLFVTVAINTGIQKIKLPIFLDSKKIFGLRIKLLFAIGGISRICRWDMRSSSWHMIIAESHFTILNNSRLVRADCEFPFPLPIGSSHYSMRKFFARSRNLTIFDVLLFQLFHVMHSLWLNHAFLSHVASQNNEILGKLIK